MKYSDLSIFHSAWAIWVSLILHWQWDIFQDCQMSGKYLHDIREWRRWNVAPCASLMRSTQKGRILCHDVRLIRRTYIIKSLRSFENYRLSEPTNLRLCWRTGITQSNLYTNVDMISENRTDNFFFARLFIIIIDQIHFIREKNNLIQSHL